VLSDERLDVVCAMPVRHVAHLAVVDEDEQPGLAQVLQLRNDHGYVGILDGAFLRLAPLADIVEEEDRPIDLHVFAADGGQSVRGLGLRAFFIAYAKEALIDEPDDGGEDMIAIELAALEIGADA